MAYSETIKLVTGDTEPMLTITLRDANTAAPGQTLDENDSNTWAPIDLTGATVRLRMRAIGSSTVKSVLTMAISNALNGVVTTNFPPERSTRLELLKVRLRLPIRQVGYRLYKI